MDEEKLPKKASLNESTSFQNTFIEFQNQLKSYLYRLLTDKDDAADILQDTFLKANEKLSTFRGESSLKTWVFQIATNLAYDHLRKYKRWNFDAQDKAKAHATNNQEMQMRFRKVNADSVYGAYEIKEHIDFCFTCIAKALPIEDQVAIILKDIYDFSVKDVCIILDKSEGVVKHLLLDSRKILTKVFEDRCALVNKKGICHQCSELNGIFNPKQNSQEELMKIDFVKNSKKYNREELYKMRTELVKFIDPTNSNGRDIQDILMKCTRQAIQEISEIT